MPFDVYAYTFNMCTNKVYILTYLVFNDDAGEDKILIQSLYLKGYPTKRVDRQISSEKLDKAWC